MIDALKSKYPLPDLLKRLGLSKSSYYYQEAAPKQPGKYSDYSHSDYVSFSGKINSGMDTGALWAFETGGMYRFRRKWFAVLCGKKDLPFSANGAGNIIPIRAKSLRPYPTK